MVNAKIAAQEKLSDETDKQKAPLKEPPTKVLILSIFGKVSEKGPSLRGGRDLTSN